MNKKGRFGSYTPLPMKKTIATIISIWRELREREVGSLSLILSSPLQLLDFARR